ncbi:uncharacterized protein J3R85_016530 [Psidium guajava]|nr:uncharacterized protein J3R85_016530 [Psidium guajava]
MLGLALTVLAVGAAPDESLITHVPGFDGTLPANHYAGPFNFQAGKSNRSLPILSLNPFSWSKVSDIIHLDFPCGVGLSYSEDPQNYVTGDLQAASDTHAFLLNLLIIHFLDLVVRALSRIPFEPILYSGESYARVYVPTLASKVVHGIKKGEKPLINFKGYLIGNGIADDEYDGNDHVPFFFGMALISIDIFEDCQATCKGKFYDPPNDRCLKNILKAHAALTGLNRYDILKLCYRYPDGKVMSLPFGLHQLGLTEKPLYTRKRTFGCGSPLGLSEQENTDTSSLQQANAFLVPCIVSDLDFLACMIGFPSPFRSHLAVTDEIPGHHKSKQVTIFVLSEKARIFNRSRFA